MTAHEPPANSRGSFALPLPRMDSLASLGLRLSRQFAQCRREGGQLAMLWVEIDVLEKAGDTLADEARDQLIQAVSQRLRNRVRGADEVVRVGEQSFAVLLMAAGAREAEIVELRLLQMMRGTYGVGDRLLHVGVRLGASTFPEAGRNGTELAEAARANAV